MLYNYFIITLLDPNTFIISLISYQLHFRLFHVELFLNYQQHKSIKIYTIDQIISESTSLTYLIFKPLYFELTCITIHLKIFHCKIINH